VEAAMPYRAVAEAALQQWREAVRRQEAEAVDTPAWQQAGVEAETAKDAYQQAIDDARRAHTPLPPPFETACE
jgi:hypothetical protein